MHINELIYELIYFAGDVKMIFHETTGLEIVMAYFLTAWQCLSYHNPTKPHALHPSK